VSAVSSPDRAQVVPDIARASVTWTVLLMNGAGGAWNMAVDMALLEHALRTGSPWMRLYWFDPPTITLGRSERAEEVLDLAACAADGVGVARRPTGGRAVLHDAELTYCVAIPNGAMEVASDREAVSRVVGELLADALARVGVPADIVRTTAPPSRGAGYRSCFASASRWEVSARGRKIVGSAQRRWPGAVLQHGSILLGPSFRRLHRYLRGADATASAELARATCVSEAVGRSVTADDTAAAVLAALAARGVEVRVSRDLPEKVRVGSERILAADGALDPLWHVLRRAGAGGLTAETGGGIEAGRE
jgi:lipoate-protein ligase A